MTDSPSNKIPSQDLGAILESMRKVDEILLTLTAERVQDPGRWKKWKSKIEDALISENDLVEDQAHDITFHLTDWPGEAAFLLALHFFPEQFTKKEIVDGISVILAHVPNHLAAAAKLWGFPFRTSSRLGRSTIPLTKTESVDLKIHGTLSFTVNSTCMWEVAAVVNPILTITVSASAVVPWRSLWIAFDLTSGAHALEQATFGVREVDFAERGVRHGGVVWSTGAR